jgi:hypothetical protein
MRLKHLVKGNSFRLGERPEFRTRRNRRLWGTHFIVANNGTGRSDLFQAGAFITAYLSGALAYGWQDVTTDRTVTVAGMDQLHANFNANAWSGRVEGGDRFVAPVLGGVGFTPYAAGQFTTFELPAYAEGVISGANTFALAYGAKSVTDTRSELGLCTDKSFAMQSAILTMRGRLAWAHDFNPDRGIDATLQTLRGASFFVNGAAQASDSALLTASAETKWRTAGRRPPPSKTSPRASLAATPARAWCGTRGSHLTSEHGHFSDSRRFPS